MKRIAVALFVVLGSISSAQAQMAEGRKAVLDNYGLATALSHRCPKWGYDLDTVTLIEQKYNIQIGQGEPDYEPMMSRARELAKRIGTIDERVACGMAQSLYGPDGMAIPKFMKQK